MLVCLHTAECCAPGTMSTKEMSCADILQLLLDFSREERWLLEAA